ncbi:hypothetical protein K491DRAFT_688435 [Lophiostoma macrostomum CBS 122681]|uniref:Uncharacterized protein n=1 Tax=Lophiostoma macrostomum CBS 122681 TaxID=1314788 RepID=A0A6A6TN69_9PLEO|nr:hypothetical protein K491DRAFT_688435 [Lophiostoma macrostomum CBS 122681]
MPSSHVSPSHNKHTTHNLQLTTSYISLTHIQATHLQLTTVYISDLVEMSAPSPIYTFDNPTSQTTPTPNPSKRMSPAERLRSADAQAEWHVRTLTEDEDHYIQLGLTYHITSLSSRSPSTNEAFPPQALQSMAHAFTISSEAEYAALWSNRRTEVSLANEARQLCITNGSPEELQQRCRKVSDLLHQCGVIRDQADVSIALLHEWITALSMAQKEFGSAGTAWALCDMIMRGAEWDLYRAWVGALPETQRLIARCGQTLDQVAERMPSQFLDEVVDDKGDVRGPLRVVNPDPVTMEIFRGPNWREEEYEQGLTTEEWHDVNEADRYEEPAEEYDPYDSDGPDSVS